jgi:dihydrofolate reductase
MQVNLIWAQDKNRVIGKDGVMPWHFSEDGKHFRKTTMGYPVIMGRKTWDSLPARFKPLPGRLNVVISSDAVTRENLSKIGCSPAKNLHEALSICEQSGHHIVWVMGGAQIYAQALPLAHKLVVTEIDAEFEGDAFAPPLDAVWRAAEREKITSVNGTRLDFVTYLRASHA